MIPTKTAQDRQRINMGEDYEVDLLDRDTRLSWERRGGGAVGEWQAGHECLAYIEAAGRNLSSGRTPHP